MRSVVVVFPASMCAMMPMLRMRSSGVVRAIAVLYSKNAGRPRRPTLGRSRSAIIGRPWGPLDAVRCAAVPSLPPVMRERPVGLRHPVRVFLLLDRLALALRREDQLRRQPLRHVLLLAGAAVLDDPAHPERGTALRSHFHRHLIGGA